MVFLDSLLKTKGIFLGQQVWRLFSQSVWKIKFLIYCSLLVRAFNKTAIYFQVV